MSFDTRFNAKCSMAENLFSSMRAGFAILQSTWRCGLKRCAGYCDRYPEFVPLLVCAIFPFPALTWLPSVMIIPIYLLWHVQIKIRQKLALAVSLCLSIMMVILAIVRISRFRSSSSTIDFTWDIFWQFAESCTAVTMVSFTAFRSLFVAHATQQSPKKSSYSSWRYPRAEKRQRDAEALDGESQEMQSLPERPRPALTGMRTSIRGERANSKGGFLKTKGSDGGDEPWPLQDEAGGQGIRVHHSVSMDTEVVSSTFDFVLGDSDERLRLTILSEQILHAGQKPEYRNFV